MQGVVKTMTVMRDGWSVYQKLLSQYSVTELGHIGLSEDYDCYTRWNNFIFDEVTRRETCFSWSV
jgi:hypothetical protein